MPKKKSAKTTTIKNNDNADAENSKKIIQEEFERMVLELAKKSLTAEKIGEELRKQKIHPKNYNKKISKILKENNLYFSPDLKNVEEKFNRIKVHSEKNKQDKRALNEKSRVFSQIRKIKQYNQRVH